MNGITMTRNDAFKMIGARKSEIESTLPYDTAPAIGAYLTVSVTVLVFTLLVAITSLRIGNFSRLASKGILGCFVSLGACGTLGVGLMTVTKRVNYCYLRQDVYKEEIIAMRDKLETQRNLEMERKACYVTREERIKLIKIINKVRNEYFINLQKEKKKEVVVISKEDLIDRIKINRSRSSNSEVAV